MKLTLFYILPVILLFSISVEDSFANHGSGGGGGCSGDCTPPSMGIDERDRQVITDGFSIDDQSFDVSQFSQSIPTQIYPVGKPIDVSVLIYENSGAFYLTYVQLMLGEKDVLIEGQLIPEHNVQIIWEKTLDGEESFSVIDKNNFVTNVDVHSFVDGDPVSEKITRLTFTFTPTKTFDTNPVIVNMWDYNRNSWSNYFNNALEISDKNLDPPSEITFSKDSELQIPSWIKSNAGFWADDLIDDSTFVTGIQYCIDHNIIHIPDLPKYIPENTLPFVDISKGSQHYLDRYYNEPSYKEWFDTNFPDYTIEEAIGLTPNSVTQIPDWIKTNAGWWAKDNIDNDTFISGIKFLVENRIIII